MSGIVPYIGSKISLISKSEIRYEGILYTIDPKESTVALQNVRSFGTEGRRKEGEMQIAPSNEVYDYIIFRGSDIKDLHVCEPPQPQTRNAPNDPAIIAMPTPPQNQGQGYPNQNFGMPPGQFPMGYQQQFNPNFNPYYMGNPSYFGAFQQQQQSQMQQQQRPGPQDTKPNVDAKTSAQANAPQQTKPAATQPAKGATATTPAPTQQQPQPTTTPAPSSATQTAPSQTQTQAPQPASTGVQAPQTAQVPQQTPQVPQQQQQQTGQPSQSAPAPVTEQSGQFRSQQVNQNQQHNQQNQQNRGGYQRRNFNNNYNSGGNQAAWGRGGSNMSRGGGGQRRGGGPGRQFGGNAPRVLDDFDFESANSRFDKEKLLEELGEKDGKVDHATTYDKTSSFFDNISCEATDRMKDDRATRNLPEQRKLDHETFGMSRGGHYRGRGGPRRYNSNPNSNSANNANSGGYQQNTGGYQQNTGGFQQNTGGFQQNTGGYQSNRGTKVFRPVNQNGNPNDHRGQMRGNRYPRSGNKEGSEQ